MRHRFQIVRRALPALPVEIVDQTPDQQRDHARRVKAFVRDYQALEHKCASAQSHNNGDAQADFIDAMKDMERRIRFVPMEGDGDGQ